MFYTVNHSSIFLVLFYTWGVTRNQFSPPFCLAGPSKHLLHSVETWVLFFFHSLKSNPKLCTHSGVCVCILHYLKKFQKTPHTETDQALNLHIPMTYTVRVAILKLWDLRLDFILSLLNMFLCTYLPPKHEKSKTELELDEQLALRPLS